MMPLCSKNPPAGKLAALALVGMLALLTPWACSEPLAEPAVIESQPPPADPDLVRLDPEAVAVANIRVAPVETAALRREIRVPGRVTVDEDLTARVGSFAEGTVVECCEPVGAQVKEGHILARLHSHEVHDAESNHRRAHEELQRSRAELEYAEQAYRRASRLYELKAGSLQQVQEAETKLKGAETTVAIAEAELRRAESHLRYLGITPPTLEHSENSPSSESHDPAHDAHLLEVRSPISGTIIERRVSPGAVVTPSDPLYVISDLSRLWVIAQVPEEQLAALREGMPVEISVRAYPNKSFPGRIAKIGDTLDPETRTVQVRCDLGNPGRQLKAEMYATVVIHAGMGEPSVVVPLSAVQQLEAQQAVFVPTDQGAYRVRPVETGRQSDSRIEVLRGLEQGEKVVVEGAFHLKSELLKSQMLSEE